MAFLFLYGLISQATTSKDKGTVIGCSVGATVVGLLLSLCFVVYLYEYRMKKAKERMQRSRRVTIISKASNASVPSLPLELEVVVNG